MQKHVSSSSLDISKLKVGDMVVTDENATEHISKDTICLNSGYAQMDSSSMVHITRQTLIGKKDLVLSKEEIVALYNSFCK